MTDTPRCEPPEALRSVDGWHWVQAPVGEPHLAQWHAPHRHDVEPLWTSTHHVYSGTPSYSAREWGWRYIAPVATPAEVEALWDERDTIVAEAKDCANILVTYDRDLRAIAGVVDRQGVEVDTLRKERDALVAEAFHRTTRNAALRARVERLEVAAALALVVIQEPPDGHDNKESVLGIVRAALEKGLGAEA